jgi:hypothetical protein
LLKSEVELGGGVDLEEPERGEHAVKDADVGMCCGSVGRCWRRAPAV